MVGGGPPHDQVGKPIAVDVTRGGHRVARPVGGIRALEIACDYSPSGTVNCAETNRPRDVVAVNGDRFVAADALSSSHTRRRRNATCGDDCAIPFGSDVLGARDCTSVCTPERVRRVID